MTANQRGKSRVPEYVCTVVRKVEPVGGDMVRVYCSIECNGGWDDQCTILIPIVAVHTAAKFVSDAALEIFDEAHPSEIVQH